MVDRDLSAAVFARVSSVQVVLFDFARDVPEQVALVAAQAESAQVFAVPELVARAESRVVGPDLSEALVARAFPDFVAGAGPGHGVRARSALPVLAELLKVVVQAAAAESARGALEHLALAVARVGPGRAAVARVAGCCQVARDRSETACVRAAVLARYP